MTSARWQNKKPQTLSHHSHQLRIITIYDPKSLYENSRNQLRNLSNPDKLKAKKEQSIETGKKSHFIKPTIALSPSQHTIQSDQEKKLNSRLFSWEGKR